MPQPLAASPGNPAEPGLGALDGFKPPVCMADLAAAVVASPLPPPPSPTGTIYPDPNLIGLPGGVGPGGLPYKPAWGVIDLKLFPDARRVAPNGVPFHPISSLDLDFNLWLWPRQRLYAFGLARFWVMQDNGQPMIEGPKSDGKSRILGVFNWAKREFDLTIGGAWNYYGQWEARVFAYSLSNLNRGTNLVSPYGFNDGLGVENRYYLSAEYARLGQDGFDISRATFLSIGYEPSKVLMGLDGQFFAPGPFVHAYLTYDLSRYRSYLFSDIQLLGNSALQPKELYFDGGLAITPMRNYRMFEIRVGTEIVGDYQDHVVRSNWLPYIQGRLNF
jgi:hypothetical protein